jgi:hypothetical protein
VKVAHESLVEAIRSGDLYALPRVAQDKSLEMRYTRNADFTDAVASEYLARALSPGEIKTALESRELSVFLNPYIA